MFIIFPTHLLWHSIHSNILQFFIWNSFERILFSEIKFWKDRSSLCFVFFSFRHKEFRKCQWIFNYSFPLQSSDFINNIINNNDSVGDREGAIVLTLFITLYLKKLFSTEISRARMYVYVLVCVCDCDEKKRWICM